MGLSDSTIWAIFDQAAVGIAQVSLDGAWLLVNSRYCEMLGYSEAELRSKTLQEITHPGDYAESLAGRNKLLEGAITAHAMEKRFLRKDGTIFWGKLHRSLVRNSTQAPEFFIAVLEDITEKKQAERALHESEQRLRLALSAGLGLWDVDLRGNTAVLAPHYEHAFGRGPSGVSEWLGLVHPDDRPQLRTIIRDSLRQGRDWEGEFRTLSPDGSVRWLLSKGTVVLDEESKPACMTGVSFDITERKRAEAALRESEERFRHMADTAPVMIWVTGPDQQATFFNKAYLDFTGDKLDRGSTGWIEGVHPEDQSNLVKVFSTSTDLRKDFHSVFRLRRADGEYRWVVCTGVPRFAPGNIFVGYIGSCIDITDLRQAQEEAQARQKWESLGVMANGIAHDFNNMLGGILASTELALSECPDSFSIEEELVRIKSACVRGAGVVGQLMIYAGNENPSFEQLNVSVVVQELLELMKFSISKQAVLETDLGANLPTVLANAAQIRQAVMNLVINASESLEDRRGTIRVATTRCNLRQPQAALDTALPQGEYLRLEVSDTGRGITPEVRSKMFDPFFTTKGPGRGLGLALVQGIIRTHGGMLNVESEPGKGSRFEILLPCIDRPVVNPGKISDPEPTHEAGTGTVLVIEDEEVLRLAVAKLLRNGGFSVIEAGDGATGASLFAGNQDRIDVVLLDVTLPGMSGREVLEELRRLKPDVKIILTSAFGEKDSLRFVGGSRPWTYIRKPYRLNELKTVIRSACGARTPGTGRASQN